VQEHVDRVEPAPVEPEVAAADRAGRQAYTRRQGKCHRVNNCFWHIISKLKASIHIQKCHEGNKLALYLWMQCNQGDVHAAVAASHVTPRAWSVECLWATDRDVLTKRN
jgi:hypothetical protein